MRLFTLLALVVLTTLAISSTPAYSDTTATEKFDPARMWECPQTDGSSMYTNKERPGCKLMDLKPLSIVPSLDNMATYRPATAIAPHYDVPAYSSQEQIGAVGGEQAIPDWAREWHASIASSGPVHAELCSMYGEWLNLNQKSRGGVFFGSDPSYGGDLSGQNRRGPSYSFNDNARYIALSRIFGQGFIPIGCQ